MLNLSQQVPLRVHASHTSVLVLVFSHLNSSSFKYPLHKPHSTLGMQPIHNNPLLMEIPSFPRQQPTLPVIHNTQSSQKIYIKSGNQSTITSLRMRDLAGSSTILQWESSDSINQSLLLSWVLCLSLRPQGSIFFPRDSAKRAIIHCLGSLWRTAEVSFCLLPTILGQGLGVRIHFTVSNYTYWICMIPR